MKSLNFQPIKRHSEIQTEIRLCRARNIWALSQRIYQAITHKMANMETLARLEHENEELERELRLLQWQYREALRKEAEKHRITDFTIRDILAKDIGPHLEELRAEIERCLIF